MSTRNTFETMREPYCARPQTNSRKVGAIFQHLIECESDNLDPDMTTKVLQQPTVHALGDELTVEGVVAALKSMGNSKAGG